MIISIYIHKIHSYIVIACQKKIYYNTSITTSLQKSLVSDRGDGLGDVLHGLDVTGLAGLGRKSLQENLGYKDSKHQTIQPFLIQTYCQRP